MPHFVCVCVFFPRRPSRSSLFKNFLREQPGHTVQLDLINKAVELLAFMVGSPRDVASFSSAEKELIAQTLDLLTEAMLGEIKPPQPRN